MKRVICQTCEGEGEFPAKGNYLSYEDCEDCRGLGWVNPPEEEDDYEDRD